MRKPIILLCAAMLFACSKQPAIDRDKFERKAEQGDAIAQTILGAMYENGIGVLKDEAKAFEWYQKASFQGIACAQCNLGCMYADGRGVPIDIVRAYAWINVASADDTPNPARVRDKREEIRKNLTPEQKAEAQELSAELAKQIHKK